MTDNITGTDFSGGSVTIATDQLSDGSHAGKVVLANQDGSIQDLTEQLKEICIRLADIGDSVGNLTTDVTNRLRIVTDVASAIGAVSTVTTVGTVTNQAQIGGLAATQHMMYLSQMAEQNLRQNVVYS